MKNLALTYDKWLQKPRTTKSFGIIFLNNKFDTCYCWYCGFVWNEQTGPSIGFNLKEGLYKGYHLRKDICVPCFGDMKHL